ncbi:alpha/beta hydrolase [Mycolicibacterium moriokaense]|uniref:Esterase n=1 Tax=Mycolicibacterium moriokaense TaxID=39691 RepID=A0AAD1H8J9_9MYCO|nr:alpha/beta hydrolase [Mycolicibacterium moriokaense]MCV7037787.1 alpha/beta hydrolase [Mycolicibacterium moriokaense]ORB22224.1 alpha/beta hydrolase [Mycolicibacterium moriokaense]BBW99272.1 esterase [Mycolicibacterium moriokaense]
MPRTSRTADFHPDLRRAARLAPKQAFTPVTLPVLRLVTRRMWRKAPKDVEALTLPSGVRVWLYRPAGVTGAGPALLWIHGGGYVIGHPGQDVALCRRYAQRLGATVASVDYGLAPEHSYPVPLEDCYNALTWLAALPSVDPSRIAIGGASAGGGLAAALALLARDRGEVALAAQLLVYPMLDDRTVGHGLDHPGLRLWNQSLNKFGWSAYLGDADPEVAVPARRTDLSGLPPAWMGVGTHDLFHDEDLAYAERLKAAGVPCDVEVVKGAFHGFDGIAPKAHVSQSFFESQCATLQRLLTLAAA